MTKSNYILSVMIGVAVVALGIGAFMVFKRSRNYEQPQQQNQQSDQTTPNPTPPPVSTQIPSDWKLYTNDKYSFQLNYPPYLKVGAVSSNSALGTFQDPVKGFHVGPLVLVALKDPTLKQQAVDYFTAVMQEANQPPQTTPEGPSVTCKIDKISNSSVTVKSVSCNGEGGPARYAYITGTGLDVFVDGYSKGFDQADNGNLKDGDYEKILSSFKFTTAATTPNPTPPTSSNPNPTTPPPVTPPQTATIQKFSISADDSGATPASINVTKGNTIEITFNVAAAGVYYGGLDFRSSVVNSGTVYSGESKTISFIANQSFSFTPYWPASQVAKSYRINVVVQ